MSEENQLDDVLLDMLVCPIDNKSLAYLPTKALLYNPRLKKSYPIRNSIPVMLKEESIDVSDEDHEIYMKNINRYTGPEDKNV